MNKDSATFNWFPGHMAKANRELEESIKLVDVIIEIRDARMPFASFNKEFKKIYNNKKRLIVFNKADLIDTISQNKIINLFKEEEVLLVDAKSSSCKNKVLSKIKELAKAKIEKNLKRGIRSTEIRVMVIGIPNVGKSTLINTLSSKKSAKVENKPGVTRSLQWVQIDKTIKLLDTPGILAPKFNNKNDSLVLSLLGSVNDDVVDIQEVSEFACKYLNDNYKDSLIERYGVDVESNFIHNIAIKNNIYRTNNVIDEEKTARMIINDARNTKFGKIVWEKLDA